MSTDVNAGPLQPTRPDLPRLNRALMRQELTFLDHLIRISGERPQGGAERLMDVEA